MNNVYQYMIICKSCTITFFPHVQPLWKRIRPLQIAIVLAQKEAFSYQKQTSKIVFVLRNCRLGPGHGARDLYAQF